METFFNQQNNHGTMDEDGDPCGVSSSSSSDVSGDSIASSLSDLAEDAASGSSSSLSSTSSADRIAGGPLYEMSTMMNQLPFKRGLSKHFQGKSQSFSSLSKVRSLEDLAKQEKPHKKGKWCSRGISKKASRASFSSSHTTKRNTSFLLCNKLPPIPVPQRHGSLSSLKPLFA